MLKILHMAPQNYAGVPYDFYKMHIENGDLSRLVTYHKNPISYPEDICLNFPLPQNKLASLWRKKKVSLKEFELKGGLTYFKPKNPAEKIYFNLSDMLRKGKVNQTIEKYNLNDFEIIHYDAGLDVFRNSSLAKRWKGMGKKIVCCYYGSDLRIRGLIREMDQISDLNITSEYDHLVIKKDLHYIFYPYNTSELPERKKNVSGRIKIVHSPTNRKYKGTDLILRVMDRIKEKFDIEFILLENMPRQNVLEIKSGCDICIDQVGGNMGGTGYGKAGLETLSMGIPTITNMTEQYAEWLPENPFVVANNGKDLYDHLTRLISSEQMREDFGIQGKLWVEKYHGFKSVNARLMELYREKKII